MANDADPERSVNGSVDVLTEPAAQPSEPAGTQAGGDVDDDTTDTAASETAATCQDVGLDADERAQPLTRNPIPGFRIALTLGLVTVLALGGLAGWLGYGAYRAYQAQQQRSRFLAVGKQGAVNLTTINYTEADADVQRILDSSTGQFYDDFAKRAPALVDVVKQAQSKTQGSVTDAGVESISGDSAQVLVAVAVNTTNAGAPDPSARHWRMRIAVKKVGDTVKVSKVGFVP